VPTSSTYTTSCPGQESLRVGVIGTGYWARWCHGTVLADRDDVNLVGFWGRSRERAAKAAAEIGGVGYHDLDALIEDVDAVSLAVSPEVQASVAVRAARAGKHLMLDKPLALDLNSADAVVDATTASNVVTVSFMTLLFQQRVRDWLAEMRGLSQAHGQWEGVAVTWAGSIEAPDSPYTNSAWRRIRGGLWDLGPHALSVADDLLGPPQAIAAMRGARDTVHLSGRHLDDALSAITVTITTPPGAEDASVALWGPAGRYSFALPTEGLRGAFSRAVDEWLAAVSTGAEHKIGARYGRHLVAVLDAAERSLATGRTTHPPDPATGEAHDPPEAR
jgi:predicted dehydrogenase